jgi:hypothetical protein
MITRLFFSLVLSFVLSSTGILLLPNLGRVAQPLLCEGPLEPRLQPFNLSYRCTGAGGEAQLIPAGQVIRASLPLLILILLPPTYLLLGLGARRAGEARDNAERDLAAAVGAQAEVLQVARHGNLKRQILMRAAELRLVLWVQPPQGRPYEATVAWLVEDDKLSLVHVGAVLPVQINPLQPQRIYPAQPWAHYAWWL